MDQVGDDLLAHAALAGDEHVGFRRGDLGNEVFNLHHAPVLEHRRELRLGALEEGFERLGFLAQARRLAHQFLLLEGPLHERKKLLGGVGFGDEVKGPQLDGLDGVGERVLAGEHDHLDAGRGLLHLREHLQTTRIR